MRDSKYEQLGMHIRFEFIEQNLRKLCCGIIGHSGNVDLKKIRGILKAKCTNGEWQNDTWAILNCAPKYCNWDSQTLLEIRDNTEAFLSFIDEQHKYYSDVLDKAIEQAKRGAAPF